MLLEMVASRELLPTVRMAADPGRSMDLELMSEPESTTREAGFSLEAAPESADIWAQVLHNMFPMGTWSIQNLFKKTSATLASKHS